MTYCPQCGAKSLENEKYCVICGSQLPMNIEERTQHEHKGFNKWWLAPLLSVVLVLLLGIGLHFYLEYTKDQARAAYEEGTEYALDGQFSQAKEQFELALQYHPNNNAAEQGSKFMSVAIEVHEQIQSIDSLVEEEAYQQALNLTKEAEERLSPYNGEVINYLLSEIVKKREQVKTLQIESRLAQGPSIDELKMLLWQVESIETDKATELASTMKERIVNYTFTNASESLQENQFTEALAIVDDGLRYVPENERLSSLKSTIESQKLAFENNQRQRTEQALSQFELEQEQNANDAIELVNIEVDPDEFGDVVVKGKVKSIATVPIYSVSVEYNLLNEDDEVVLENQTIVVPEDLFPEETGTFEYTHYDVTEEVTVEINKISWFLENQ
ncbi:zinc ribbon domain-containing protein [Halalkalibacillus sediminis]|uniref:Zinc ribbon domain-containing protein n=1 Tax=Halalkalibacillus sediminis TaxID=2018042 RepID=A0A2I0QVU0_9BACI|nr:FxLYD domain-containing protein [Halalkalibacillus sediminis]PKR78453.1 zinc ribbon domain-containing protein [Halalkalibacillus sediminis]